MLDNIPIKKRLIGILVMLSIAAIMLSVYCKQTITLFSDISNLETKTRQVDTAEEQMISLNLQQQKLNHRITMLQRTNVTLPNHISFLEYAEQICSDLDLLMVRLPHEKVVMFENHQIATIRLQIEGSFHNLLRMIHKIEQEDRTGSIGYLAFRKEDIRRAYKKESVLLAQVELNRLIN